MDFAYSFLTDYVLPCWQRLNSLVENDIGAWVALFAMIATAWQASIARKHNKLSVTPHITIWKHEDLQTLTYKFELINNGVGPAVIKSIRIVVDGQLATGKELEPYRVVADKLFPNIPINISGSYFAPGFMLPAEKSLPLVNFQFAKNPCLTKPQLDSALERVNVVIRYQSIYKKRYKYDSEKIRKTQRIN